VRLIVIYCSSEDHVAHKNVDNTACVDEGSWKRRVYEKLDDTSQGIYCGKRMCLYFVCVLRLYGSLNLKVVSWLIWPEETHHSVSSQGIYWIILPTLTVKTEVKQRA
jgi:hypothetical protein